jgi:hypothetical protein
VDEMENHTKFKLIDKEEPILSGTIFENKSKNFWDDSRIFSNPKIELELNGNTKTVELLRTGNHFETTKEIGAYEYRFLLHRVKNNNRKFRLLISLNEPSQKKKGVA